MTLQQQQSRAREKLESLIRFHTHSMDGQDRPKLIVATNSLVESLISKAFQAGREEVVEVLKDKMKTTREDIEDNSDDEQQEGERLRELQITKELIESALSSLQAESSKE